MKSNFFFVIAAMFMFVSCMGIFEMDATTDFDETYDVFSATTESDAATRTSLSDYSNEDGSYSLNWSSGDAISIYDGKGTAVYSTNDSYTSTAEFFLEKGQVSNNASQYVAFYPSTITTSNMVLPSAQNYVNKNVENFPMRAVSSSKELEFKNLCGILRFCLKADESGKVKISSISLSADKGMSGKFTVGNDNAAIVTGTDGVVLNCSDPKSLYTATATDFNIIVPQGSYNPLKVKICDVNGNEINLVSEGTVSVKRSEITRISLTLGKSAFGASLETIPITDSDVDFTER